MERELALFDLDHTLLPIDSDHAWGEFLITSGVVDPASFKAANDRFYADYEAGCLDIGLYVEFTLAPLLGLGWARLRDMHAAFMREVILPEIRPVARELVEHHKAQGDLCAIVTGTNSFITAPIARAFGIDHLIATVAAIDNGILTGKMQGVPAYREGKVTRVAAWLESMALSLETVPRSTFYSDSHNDLALLMRVTVPVATNPDATLKAAALQRGWRILDLFPRA
jgi:HAD superfamily hydrolase (TIGR01490 family)